MSQVLAQTKLWLEKVVIGLNLCPFAHKEWSAGRARLLLSKAADPAQRLEELQEECSLLDTDENIGTVLLIYPEGLQAFDDYLQFLDLAQELLSAEGFDGIYQLASFHPDYCFNGCSEGDAANYTNRSPYPMFHLLREEELSQVIDRHPDPASIPKRNEELCREMGVAKILALTGGKDEG